VPELTTAQPAAVSGTASIEKVTAADAPAPVSDVQSAPGPVPSLVETLQPEAQPSLPVPDVPELTPAQPAAVSGTASIDNDQARETLRMLAVASQVLASDVTDLMNNRTAVMFIDLMNYLRAVYHIDHMPGPDEFVRLVGRMLGFQSHQQ